MGLDHGLYRRHYVKNWSHMKPEKLHQVKILKGGMPDKNVRNDRVSFIIEDVITWRKANQIHKWFVMNVMKGVDDCITRYVPYEKVQELVNTCKQVIAASELIDGRVYAGTRQENGTTTDIWEPGKVIKDSTVAAELLPTERGFFFGDTEYDEWYLLNLTDTVALLEAELGSPNAEEDTFEYWSSW